MGRARGAAAALVGILSSRGKEAGAAQELLDQLNQAGLEEERVERLAKEVSALAAGIVHK